MINTSDEKIRAKNARDTETRSKRRVLQAQIATGLQAVLENDEQLLGFARGLIAGGLRGKLTVGFEALFAPSVNVGLTERRIILQHIQTETGKPNDILPHSFPVSDLHSVDFVSIETFGAEPSGRLTLRLYNEQHFRLRLKGEESVEGAATIANLFRALTASRPKSRTSPTQSLCPHCDRVLDRASRFCPYCGQSLAVEESGVRAETNSDAGSGPISESNTVELHAEAGNSGQPISSDIWLETGSAPQSPQSEEPVSNHSASAPGSVNEPEASEPHVSNHSLPEVN